MSRQGEGVRLEVADLSLKKFRSTSEPTISDPTKRTPNPNEPQP
jgi:hypothetical protein